MDEQEKKRLEEQAKADALKAVEAERSRVLAIRELVRNAKMSDEIAEDYIKRGASVEEARTNIELFAKYQKEQQTVESTVRVEVGTTDGEKKRDAIIEVALNRMDRSFAVTQGNEFYGRSLLRNMEALVTRKPMETDAQYATRVMTSSDLPYILANSGEKAAQKKYQAAPKTWSRWAKADSLRNFKTADRVRSGDFAALLERQENDEFKLGSMGEEREQVALKEWGIKMAFSRRMLINDDLSEVQKVIGQAGSAAAHLENYLVYGVLTSNPAMGDGENLFSSAHANECTTGALTDAEIGEAFEKMGAQSSVDGRFKLNLRPKYLICGPSVEVTARKYLAVISPTQASNVNVFSNSLELIVDSEITTNDYYFAADQNLIDTVTLFRLEGEESPRVESRISFDSEALEIKCAHSAVAKALDYRGLVMNGGGS